jgi:hypothetical protein
MFTVMLKIYIYNSHIDHHYSVGNIRERNDEMRNGTRSTALDYSLYFPPEANHIATLYVLMA